GTRFELGLSWLVPLLDRLREAHPYLTINLYFGSGPELLHRLRVMALDAVITSARLATPLLEALNLHEEAYVFVGARALLRRRPLATPDDAAAHTLLDVDDELPLYRYFAESPAAPGPLRFAAHGFLGLGAAVKARVLGGHGVAVLPRYLVEAELGRGRLLPILPAIPLLSDHFRLVFRRDDPRRAVFEELAATLRATPIT
ncbi:MAG: substrate-binding domain-containing protein, partial [Myxococcales bacterium]|nr:substrate-binding domain-containing protein [Myxococcales bacterium]